MIADFLIEMAILGITFAVGKYFLWDRWNTIDPSNDDLSPENFNSTQETLHAVGDLKNASTLQNSIDEINSKNKMFPDPRNV